MKDMVRTLSFYSYCVNKILGISKPSLLSHCGLRNEESGDCSRRIKGKTSRGQDVKDK
jgi:hypothetical protein